VKGFAFRCFALCLALVPPRLGRLLARPLGALVWRFSGRFQRVSLANMALCYPQLSAAGQFERARRSLYHYACNALELGVSWYWPERWFRGCFEAPVGQEILKAAQAEGQGVLFLAPHFGAWEMLGLAVSTELDATLFKPGSDASVNAVLTERRGRFGAQLVPANRRGLKVMMDCLQAGGTVGVLPDQEPRLGDGRFAPFFAAPALTGVLVPRLIQRTGARVVFAACLRRPGGRFQIHILPADPEIHDADMDTALAAMNRGVEAVIALDPEQYLWAYKRFRARPDGQANRY